MNSIAEFILWFLLAQAILSAVQFVLRKRQRKAAARVLLIVGKALLAIVFAVLVLAGPVQLRIVQPLMMALYAALLPDAAADVVYTIAQYARRKERRFIPYKALSLAFGVLFFAFGVINMQTVTPRYHTYSSDLLTASHTVVFIADMHVGSAQPFSVTEKTVAEIRELRADATILCGDIVDDYTTKEEMEAACRLFSDFETPVYYVFGNHDRQGHAEYAGGRKFTAEELEQTLSENGITVLRDAVAEIAPDLLLWGREDASEGEGELPAGLADSAQGKYMIVADHQPVRFKENAAAGADLQLSGHTHAGQLFPLRALYSVIGYCYGDYAEGDAVMNVSAGACGWRMPFRTDSGCHYEVVTLQPAG